MEIFTKKEKRKKSYVSMDKIRDETRKKKENNAKSMTIFTFSRVGVLLYPNSSESSSLFS